jgi:WD40 repeat protein
MRLLERVSVLVAVALIGGWPCLGQERLFPGFPVRTSISPDGTLLAVARVAHSGGDIEVWALPELKLKRRWSWQSGGSIRCVALSDDGRFVAAGGSAVRERKPVEARDEQEQTGQVIVWEIESGVVAYRFDSGLHIESLAFSPDQPLLATSGLYPYADLSPNSVHLSVPRLFEIHLWDARNGAHIRKAVDSDLLGAASQLQFSADGSTLLAAFSGRTWRLPRRLGREGPALLKSRWAFDLVICNLRTGKTQRRLVDTPRHLYFLSGCGRNWIATREEEFERLSNPSVRPPRIGLWDLESLKRKREYLTPPGTEIFHATASADGNSLVLLTQDSVDWLDPETGLVTRNVPVKERLREYGPDIRVLSPDAGKVLVVSPETLQIQDLTTGRVHAADTGYKEGILFEPSLDPRLLLSLSGMTSVSFSPDGRTVAAGSEHGELFVWDLRSAQLLLDVQGHESPIRRLAFLTETGRLLAAADDGSVNTWSMESGELLSSVRVSSVRTSALALSRDGVYVSAGGPDFGFRELEVATGNVRKVLTESNLTFSSLCYSPVDRLLAWGRPDGRVDLLDLSAGAERRRLRQAGLPATKCLAFSPDGTRLVTGAEDGGIEIWDVKTGKILEESDAHDGSVTALSFSSQDLLATGGEDRTLKLWRNGRREASLKGHESPIHALAFSSDGQFVAAATGNRSLCVWSVAQGKLFTVLRPPVRR